MSRVPDRAAGAEPTNTDSSEARGSHAESLDAVFDVLSAERRRHALYELYRRAGEVALDDLVDAVSSSVGANPARVAADLHHVHLPKLDEEGVAEYDREAGVARLADNSDRLDRYLSSAATDEGEPLRRTGDTQSLSEF